MIKHPAFKELQKILQERDWTEFCPEKNREAMFEAWMEKWIVEVEQSQSVVNPKYLDSEHSDFIRYRMGQVLGEALTEECVNFKNENKKITATMVGLRRSK
jgi:hypothetical protein